MARVTGSCDGKVVISINMLEHDVVKSRLTIVGATKDYTSHGVKDDGHTLQLTE